MVQLSQIVKAFAEKLGALMACLNKCIQVLIFLKIAISFSRIRLEAKYSSDLPKPGQHVICDICQLTITVPVTGLRL